VEAVCRDVIIINKGQVVATDSVENLTQRMRGSDAVAVEVETDGIAGTSDVVQRLEQISGVSKVLFKGATDHRMTFEVEGLPGQTPRADVARAVVNAGWNLLELRSLNYSLEEVFLQLTGGAPQEPQEVTGEQPQ
jgi:ABC-2 type transport system ATP-binding protein